MRHVSFPLFLFQFWTCDACVPAYCYNGCNYGYQATSGCNYGYNIGDNCGYGGNCYQAAAPVYAVGQPAVSTSHLDGPDIGTIAAIGGGVLAAGAAASAAGIAGLAATGGTLYLARKLRAQYKENKEEKDQESDTSIGTSNGRGTSRSRSDSKNNASWNRISENRQISLGDESVSRSRTRQESVGQSQSNDSESRINLSSARSESAGLTNSARRYSVNGESGIRISHDSRVSQSKKSVRASNTGQSRASSSKNSESRKQLGSLRDQSSRVGRSSRGYSKSDDWSNRISMDRRISVVNGSVSRSDSRQEALSYRDSDSKSRTNLAFSRADSSRKLPEATSVSNSKGTDIIKSSSGSKRNPDSKIEMP